MSDKNLTSRKHQAIQTKELLLNTSLDLISQKGYDNVHISEICQAVGVSTGAFYHHFKGKEDIIVEAYKRFDQHYENYVIDNLSLLAAIDQVIESIKYQVKYAEDMGIDTMRQFYRSQLQAGRKFFISTERAFPKMLTQMIERAQHDGELTKTYPPTLITRQLLRFSRGMIYDWCAYRGTYDIVEETIKSLSLFLVAFKHHGEKRNNI